MGLQVVDVMGCKRESLHPGCTYFFRGRKLCVTESPNGAEPLRYDRTDTKLKTTRDSFALAKREVLYGWHRLASVALKTKSDDC